jgi:heme exporter protein B
MVLSLFGFTLRHAELDVVRVLVWVSAILAMLMGTQAWFSHDHRVQWLLAVQLAAPRLLGHIWLARCILLVVAQALLLVPVSALMLVQSGADWAQVWPLAQALVLGLLAMAPMLGLLALLVLMTRAASVLVYLLALPLLLPVMVFGVEASQAAVLGRQAAPALAVLASLAAFGFCVGVPLSRRLIQLSQE